MRKESNADKMVRELFARIRAARQPLRNPIENPVWIYRKPSNVYKKK